MTKNKSNIFKLSKDEFHNYELHPFEDCMPGAEEYAECMLKTIKTKETPYVLMLNGMFGMGKTFFATRFTQYLRNQNIHCVYFSVWEYDYLDSPFEIFSKEILAYINSNVSKLENTKDSVEKLIKSTIELLYNMSKSVSFNAGINIPQIANLNGTISGKDLLEAGEQFINNFKKEKDAIQEFKIVFKDFIKRLPNKRLTLIIDELDRCRPDHAMKTLEIIKHFYDIEGLFIILTTNKKSMNKCVQSLYGITEKNSSSECYFNKFFDDIDSLYSPNYIKLVEKYINEDSLSECIKNEKITVGNNRYNSLQTLQDCLSRFGEKEKLTIREIVSICEKAIYICKNIKHFHIDCEYLAYKLCSNASRQNSINIQLSEDHPLFQGEGRKYYLLTISLPETIFKPHNRRYFEDLYPSSRTRTLNNYSDLENALREIENHISNGYQPRHDTNYVEVFDFSSNAHTVQQYITQKRLNVAQYQKHYNSDDNDIKLKEYYDTIIEKQYKIHE